MRDDLIYGTLNRGCDPCNSARALYSVGLIPGLFAVDSSVGQNPYSTGPIAVPAPPFSGCPARPLPLFMNGFSYPIAPGAVTISIPGVVVPVDPAFNNLMPIVDDPSLLAFLNGQIIPALEALGHSTSTTFTLGVGIIIAPVVDSLPGSCAPILVAATLMALDGPTPALVRPAQPVETAKVPHPPAKEEV